MSGNGRRYPAFPICLPDEGFANVDAWFEWVEQTANHVNLWRIGRGVPYVAMPYVAPMTVVVPKVQTPPEEESSIATMGYDDSPLLVLPEIIPRKGMATVSTGEKTGAEECP
jgi:hypothetical protein